MVKALHRAGIEVILDVVFNHTAEGDTDGPTFCYRGLANDVYYILEPDQSRYADYTGCGNTLNANQPIVRRLIQDSLRYWVTEMHVDGFRFDLASILVARRSGSSAAEPAGAVGHRIRSRSWPAPSSLPRPGTRRGSTRWAASSATPGRNGTAGFATTCGASQGRRAIRCRAWPPGCRQPRHLRPQGAGSRAQHQLRDLSRRLHAERPRLLQREAQRGQRRGQSRRRQRQPELELRRRGTDRRSGDRGAAQPPGQELPRAAAAVGRHADAAHGRRGAAHPAAATTTPIARTARSAGSTGACSNGTPTSTGS